jgi:hypothetical protein
MEPLLEAPSVAPVCKIALPVVSCLEYPVCSKSDPDALESLDPDSMRTEPPVPLCVLPAESTTLPPCVSRSELEPANIEMDPPLPKSDDPTSNTKFPLLPDFDRPDDKVTDPDENSPGPVVTENRPLAVPEVPVLS